MTKDTTLIEAIGLAIRSEEDASALYGRIAGLIKNDLVKAKYLELAKEEGNHRKLLVSLYKTFANEAFPPHKIPGNPVTAEGGLPKLTSSVEDFLNFAIGREIHAQKFYKDAAKNTSDHSGKRLFEYLANVEHGHEVMLKTELEAYHRDNDWYANNPEIQLLG